MLPTRFRASDFRLLLAPAFAILPIVLVLVSAASAADPPNSEKRTPDALVTFPSFDGMVTLDGYLWLPSTPPPHPAVVAMHGCGGVFYGEPLDFDHITGKLRYWGKQLSDLGFLVLLVDGFTARGIGHEGVCAIPAADRPPEVEPTHARPFDAHAGLDYLRSRGDVALGAVGLIGWSNGGTAVLSTVASASQAPLVQNGVGIFSDTTSHATMRAEGFASTVAIYPGCGFEGHYNGSFEVYSATRIFMGAADTTVDPMTCQTRVAEARAVDSELDYFEYPGMGHGYDYDEWQSTAARETRRLGLERLALGVSSLLVDGFESGNTAAWSSARRSIPRP